MTGPGTDMIVCIQYCAISIVCVFLLIYCIVVTNRSAEHSSELMFYKLTMGFAVLCSLTDVVFALREYGQIPLGDITNYISEILYSLGSILGTYCWFIYSEKKQQSAISLSRKWILLCAVPFAVMSAFTLTTPLHRLCFSVIDSQYIRGVLNVPFTAICIFFIACSGIMALLKSFRKKFQFPGRISAFPVPVCSYTGCRTDRAGVCRADSSFPQPVRDRAFRVHHASRNM